MRDIHYGDILVKYGATVNLSSVDVPCIKPEKDISKFSINSYLQNGDIVIADTAEDYSVGKATEIIGQMELWHCKDYIPYLVVRVLNLYLCISDTI